MDIKSILIIISGSVAAYKSLELIRNFKKSGVAVDVILTKGAQEFITPLVVSSLTGNETFTDLFSLKDEVEMGHIQLSRKADAILVAPATADIIANMATGQCNDLATTTLLATDKPVFVAPAMNHKMWEHAATQRNIVQLQKDGVTIIQPSEGEMACGEYGVGRFAELTDIQSYFESSKTFESKPLQGFKAVITAGPTHEPVDPVRFLGNRSSGKQGIAIASSLADAGADVHLVLGPTHLTTPSNVKTVNVMTADEMYHAVKNVKGADIAICAAAVADWKVISAENKIKKSADNTPPALMLEENKDILKWLSQEVVPRPSLVVGFAAETENLDANAEAKLKRKACNWLLANDVSEGKVFGKDKNQIHFLPEGESWHGTKKDIASRLTGKIIDYFEKNKKKESA